MNEDLNNPNYQNNQSYTNRNYINNITNTNNSNKSLEHLLTVKIYKDEVNKNKLSINQTKLEIRLIFSIIFIISFIIIKHNLTYLSKIIDNTHFFYAFEKLYILINMLIKKHTCWRNSFYIFSSVSLDFFTLISFVLFVLYSKKYRFLLSICTYSFLVLIFQNFLINNNSLYSNESILSINNYPNFPSLLISYNKNSSFFSGIIGVLVIFIHEFQYYNFTLLSFYCLITSIFHSIIVLEIKNNSILDLIITAILGQYCFLLSSYIENLYDNDNDKKENNIL